MSSRPSSASPLLRPPAHKQSWTDSVSDSPYSYVSDLSPNLLEPDDSLHNPDISPQPLDRYPLSISSRALLNLGCLVILILCILSLFIGYPVATYAWTNFSTTSGFNLGGINGSGQVPFIGNFGMIDLETPKSVYTRPGYTDGSEYVLVFSDEFNTDGRTFYPGDDPYWEAADLHYWATNNLEWYDPAAVTTANGSLVITFSQIENHNLNFQGGELSYITSQFWS
ncbi:hypothetical protein APHAL10511_001694 [Amanita phalloides]|nr:hypothetical protein APHAL10511_001694 [Amanita phalloides]